MTMSSFRVALEGFEPPQAEPESDVLPLHHKAILRSWNYKRSLAFCSVLRVQIYDNNLVWPNFFKRFLLKNFSIFSTYFVGINLILADRL